MATNGLTREFLEELIELYRSQPALWQKRAHIYKNKYEKLKSWNMLLNKYKEMDKDATIETVKTKINSLRIAYRRELKKVIKSQKSGAGVDEMYNPQLWYFKHFHFVLDQDIHADHPAKKFKIANDMEEDSLFLQKMSQSKQRSAIFRSELGTSANLVALKKQILEQQLAQARLEHEQRMIHSAEEHKLRMQILEAELKSKQM